MQARGPLMVEHRLIERMVEIIRISLDRVETTGDIDPFLIDNFADFISFYADATHHGKEEDILFRDLSDRSLSPEDDRLMKELMEEHLFGRKTTKALKEANDRYRKGDDSALGQIEDKLRNLVDFYPSHIEKEDKVFFPASRAYFTEEEEKAMLEEFQEFDSKMIHRKYGTIVEELEAGQ
ncbi:cation-binding protein [Candidatus Fermentibacteria bacterium]|nr:cation-binding protein [Candidatus Fermentibacteria bacterium]